MTTALREQHPAPSLLRRGKVREMYEVDAGHPPDGGQ